MSTRYAPQIINPLTGAIVTPRDWHRLEVMQREDRAKALARRQKIERFLTNRVSDPMGYAAGPSVIPIDETPILLPAPSPDPIDLGAEQLNERIARFWKER